MIMKQSSKHCGWKIFTPFILCFKILFIDFNILGWLYNSGGGGGLRPPCLCFLFGLQWGCKMGGGGGLKAPCLCCLLGCQCA